MTKARPQQGVLDAAKTGDPLIRRHGFFSVAPRSALLVSAVDEEHEILDRIFFQQGWILFKARTIESALVLLNQNPVPVVITERDLPAGSWKDLLAAIQSLPDAPLLIVTDRQADEYLWAEVLNLGGYDVLGQPIQVTELLWVLGTAWRIKDNNQTQVPKPECEALFAHAK
jgi:DNA-binding response OmpR family regulator